MLSVLCTMLDSVSWTTALLIAVICVAFCAYFQWPQLNMLPGPVGLPYLGYYPFLRPDYHVHLLEMVKKYGDVFLLRCTGQLYVHLGSLKVIKEAQLTKSDSFSRRSANDGIFKYTFGDGLGFSNDEKWRVLKKFFAYQLKEFGLGRKTQERLIGDGLQRTVEIFKTSGDRNLDVLGVFTDTATEAILRLLLGGGVKVNSVEARKLIQCYRHMGEIMASSSALLAGPLFKYVFMYVKPELRKYRQCQSEMESILHKFIQQHEREFSKDNIRDLIDCFIAERKSLQEKGDPKYKIYTDSALVSTFMQFFGDGSLSIGLVIAVVLKELSSRPDVQKEIQRELDDVVGTNRLPSWDDRSSTPYTNSVIYEIMRTAAFFPLLPSVESTKETTIGNCRIPKGTITLVNFYAALNDPQVYKNPEKFDPKRFLLNEDRKPREEPPVIFGVGKRSCTGEPLANMEIFLFATTVLQNFTLYPAKDDLDSPLGVNNPYAADSIFLRATPRTI